MRGARPFLILICCLPALLGAGLYRWVDEHGVVNFSQHKPMNAPADAVPERQPARLGGTSPAPEIDASDNDDAPPSVAELDEDRQNAREVLMLAERARQEELENVRRTKCELATTILEQLTTRGRVRLQGDDANGRVMSEEERQTHISEARQTISANCGPAG